MERNKLISHSFEENTLGTELKTLCDRQLGGPSMEGGISGTVQRRVVNYFQETKFPLPVHHRLWGSEDKTELCYRMGIQVVLKT